MRRPAYTEPGANQLSMRWKRPWASFFLSGGGSGNIAGQVDTAQINTAVGTSSGSDNSLGAVYSVGGSSGARWLRGWRYRLLRQPLDIDCSHLHAVIVPKPRSSCPRARAVENQTAPVRGWNFDRLSSPGNGVWDAAKGEAWISPGALNALLAVEYERCNSANQRPFVFRHSREPARPPVEECREASGLTCWSAGRPIPAYSL